MRQNDYDSLFSLYGVLERILDMALPKKLELLDASDVHPTLLRIRYLIRTDYPKDDCIHLYSPNRLPALRQLLWILFFTRSHSYPLFECRSHFQAMTIDISGFSLLSRVRPRYLETESHD